MSDIGALALVKYEYTDKSGWKVRPGLIIGNKDLAAGGLKHKSIVRTHKTFWIEKSQCKRVGTLKTEVSQKEKRSLKQ